MGIREAKKNERRRAILDAARELILRDKNRDFSMPNLSERAGVSLVTPYNLFGSKSSILLEIVREDIFTQMSGIDDLPGDRLIDWISSLSRLLARVYYENRHFYRRMIATIAAQESAETQRATLEFGYRMFVEPVRRFQEQGALVSDVSPTILARHLSNGVAGSLQYRLMERGSEDLLRSEIEMGLLLVLSGISSDRERPALHALRQALAADMR